MYLQGAALGFILGYKLKFSLVIKSGLMFVFQSLVYDNTGKNLEIELFDEDTDKDDFLGWYNFSKSYKHTSLLNMLKLQLEGSAFAL